MKNHALALSVVCILFFANHVHSQWVHAGYPEGGRVTALAVSSNNIFAGTGLVFNNPVCSSGVYLSSNNGASWTVVVSGLPNTEIFALAVDSNDIFAGTPGNGIWRRPLSEMVSVLPQHKQSVPLQTSLRLTQSSYLHSNITLNYVI